jgi:hypothetical protein
VHARHSACDNCRICRICRIPMRHVSRPEKRRGASPKSERAQILRSETCCERSRHLSHLSHLSHSHATREPPREKAWRKPEKRTSGKSLEAKLAVNAVDICRICRICRFQCDTCDTPRKRVARPERRAPRCSKLHRAHGRQPSRPRCLWRDQPDAHLFALVRESLATAPR